eukprot:TRINITY_DN2775_c0_g1_i1.p1 TRINITY_DN2775_c0_g1~~TRINITY_DN2775_c0_g1_i1.p1  ORF type:complete len:475 (+),score=29.58 TRINITY_DN2775_c0_g1_i1:97-1425(+)
MKPGEEQKAVGSLEDLGYVPTKKFTLLTPVKAGTRVGDLQKPKGVGKQITDYSQNYVNTGMRPQNFIRDTDPSERFQDHPKLAELIKMKNDVVKKRATPPMYIKADFKNFDLSSLGKFDVILVDPPWPEYSRRASGIPLDTIKHHDIDLTPWSFDEIINLRVETLADNPSFLFLWVGSYEGLELGRMALKKWGFRRCEDIVWAKTNKTQTILAEDKGEVFRHTKEHCLVGIKGTVRRGEDAYFIHANVDTDVIVAEEEPYGSTKKPEELYEIIERFCLGRRRIELFGEDHNIRRGWLTVGKRLSTTHYDQALYESWFKGDGAYPQVQTYEGGKYLGSTAEIEAARPKSPTRVVPGTYMMPVLPPMPPITPMPPSIAKLPDRFTKPQGLVKQEINIYRIIIIKLCVLVKQLVQADFKSWTIWVIILSIPSNTSCTLASPLRQL